MSDQDNVKPEATQGGAPEPATAPPPQQQQISVQDILNNYPIDRDKARDTVLLAISNSLARIAAAMDYFVKQDAAEKEVEKIMKEEKEKARVQ